MKNVTKTDRLSGWKVLIVNPKNEIMETLALTTDHESETAFYVDLDKPSAAMSVYEQSIAVALNNHECGDGASDRWFWDNGQPVEVGDPVETVMLPEEDSDCGIVDSVVPNGVGVRWVNGGGTTVLPNADDIRYVPPRFRSRYGVDDGRPVWEGGV